MNLLTAKVKAVLGTASIMVVLVFVGWVITLYLANVRLNNKVEELSRSIAVKDAEIVILKDSLATEKRIEERQSEARDAIDMDAAKIAEMLNEHERNTPKVQPPPPTVKVTLPTPPATEVKVEVLAVPMVQSAYPTEIDVLWGVYEKAVKLQGGV